ncbi:MAG: PqqD family protein [Eubacteriales bacterium]|nr:PqqD family protein [Eubacteriales bacterium]
MVNLNQSGAILFQCLQKGATREEMALALVEHYDATEEIALRSVDAFIASLANAGLLEENG